MLLTLLFVVVVVVVVVVVFPTMNRQALEISFPKIPHRDRRSPSKLCQGQPTIVREGGNGDHLGIYAVTLRSNSMF